MKKNQVECNGKEDSKKHASNSQHQYLEVSENNLLNIVRTEDVMSHDVPHKTKNSEVIPSEDFIDDPDVPPLI